MRLFWASMVLPAGWEILVRLPNPGWKTQFPKLKKNQEKSRHCRQLRPLKKKKPVRLKIPRQRLLPLPVGKGTATAAINILTLTC